ncbi:tRNA lysidine(34) synthetase TilS [Sandaracinobacteroides saxicola]|uniref:tRNA(Ile)-lysidine synthase n=1 Tax=Sandaracinobacteroides saxicola TaxID=2759707 RepID=A0A7G5II57_9SPHN|nr:tRNA lysidine(34) synthetase TilS [Sandaracinobacteroides saxicola]QMW23049.1 tRNA lysidine(34) synthetase TilS [Sandaracinobacteroides saxicola]
MEALTGALAAGVGEAAAPFALAVSGGPDSLAMLALARAAWEPEALLALTVDHALRAEGAAEAAAVGMLCRRLGIGHRTLRWEGPKPAAGVQAAARAARYALMRDACVAAGVRWLLTAHTADDAAETLLMRLNRGAGVRGLGGIRARRDLGDGVTLLRPLLGVRRADLHAALPPDWPVVSDPSNEDARFTRTAVRRLLAGAGWLDAARLADSAAHLRAAEEALGWMAEQAWRGRVERREGTALLDVAGLPEELARRLLLRALGEPEPRGPDLARLMARLAAGGQGTLGARQVRVARDGRWRVRRVEMPSNG